MILDEVKLIEKMIGYIQEHHLKKDSPDINGITTGSSKRIQPMNVFPLRFTKTIGNTGKTILISIICIFANQISYGQSLQKYPNTSWLYHPSIGLNLINIGDTLKLQRIKGHKPKEGNLLFEKGTIRRYKKDGTLAEKLGTWSAVNSQLLVFNLNNTYFLKPLTTSPGELQLIVIDRSLVSLRASASFRRCLSIVVLEYGPINIMSRQGISQTSDICYGKEAIALGVVTEFFKDERVLRSEKHIRV